MAASCIVSLSSGKLIKPSSPTPCSLRRHNLSFLDHIASPAYTPFAYFYPKPKNNTTFNEVLENSLSKTLASYYPFAGRLFKDDDHVYVDCNDMGAEFLNVRLNCSMSEILNDPYNNATDMVFPQGLPYNPLYKAGSLLVAQLSHLECGGIVVSACISHKVADGYSVAKFMTDWAYTARVLGSINNLPYPDPPKFNTCSIFPPILSDPSALSNLIPLEAERRQVRVTTRMYNFSSSTLGKLKDSVAMDARGVANPTRVEVATAVVHKCIAGVAMEKSGSFQPSMLSHMVSLRPSPVPLDTIGNASSLFVTSAATEDDIQVPKYVSHIRKCKVQCRDKFKDLKPNQVAAPTLETIESALKHFGNKDFNIYTSTSLCNMGFYATDFGWGRPIRVKQPNHQFANCFALSDNPTGEGIDVQVTLTEEDMSIFQSNKEFLESASPLV